MTYVFFLIFRNVCWGWVRCKKLSKKYNIDYFGYAVNFEFKFKFKFDEEEVKNRNKKVKIKKKCLIIGIHLAPKPKTLIFLGAYVWFEIVFHKIN